MNRLVKSQSPSLGSHCNVSYRDLHIFTDLTHCDLDLHSTGPSILDRLRLHNEIRREILARRKQDIGNDYNYVYITIATYGKLYIRVMYLRNRVWGNIRISADQRYEGVIVQWY